MKLLIASCISQHHQATAEQMRRLSCLYEVWNADKLKLPSLSSFYRRCWPYHIAVKALYHTTTIGQRDNLLPRFFPIWDAWVRRRGAAIPKRSLDIVFSIMGYGSGPFDLAEQIGALKVVDASSSHPTSFYGFWQRECDIWNPGMRVTLPRSLFRRCTQDLERADYILCSSLFVRDSMLYNGIQESKLAVLPYGADVSTFTPSKCAITKPRFIAVGTLTLRKGTPYLLDAMRLVRQQYPQAELLMVGGVHDDFKGIMHRWRGEFTHIPSVSHSELSKLLQQSLAFVFPSCEEGFARVLSEAMAAGLPIVATHESGASTVITDGENGLIVPQRQPAALAKRLLTLIEQPELAHGIGAAASSYAKQHGSNEIYGARLKCILDDWLSTSRASDRSLKD